MKTPGVMHGRVPVHGEKGIREKNNRDIKKLLARFQTRVPGNGPHLAAGKTTKNPVMEMEEDEEVADPDWAEVDNDSDFEPEDSGKKRNNRGQDAGKGKKRRL